MTQASMARLCAAALFLCCALSARAARGESPAEKLAGNETARAVLEGREPRGLETSLGLGFGRSFGDIGKSGGVTTSAGDTIPWRFGITLDVGYRHSGFYLGAYVEGALLAVASSSNGPCPPEANGVHYNCDGKALRFGAMLRYRFGSVRDRWQPWIGAGGGYELAWIGIDGTNRGVTTSGTGQLSGPELARLQLGADFYFGEVVENDPRIRVNFGGVYLEGALGRYDKLDTSGAVTAARDFEAGLHYWVQIALRGGTVH